MALQKEFRFALVHDRAMKQHSCLTGPHVEQPERIDAVLRGLSDHTDLEVKSRAATEEELCLVHTLEYLRWVQTMRQAQAVTLDSIYIHPKTAECALLAAGSTLQLTQAVLSGQVKAGFAAVRPPGHHAEHDCAQGFCFFNNVALAAAEAQSQGKRVAIVDWDIHHGNGTQRSFYNNAQVLYISLHRYDHGHFYPGTQEGAPERTGGPRAPLSNVNITWNTSVGCRPGDAEYYDAFQRVVIPCLTRFSPDLILVSCGFDAGKQDPLGGCHVSPEGFGLLAALLKEVCSSIVFVLEGGYNLETIEQSALSIGQVMMGCKPLLPTRPPHKKFKHMVDQTRRLQRLPSLTTLLSELKV